MNLKQINEFRVAHGLSPLPAVTRKGNSGNAAKRAQDNRDTKSKRNGKGK